MVKCLNCGACCTFTNGAPFIYPEDVNEWLRRDLWGILNELRLTIEINEKNKEESVQQWTFNEDPVTHECKFRRNGHCAIYKTRPIMCQFYPGSLPCHSGLRHDMPSKHLTRQFRAAQKNWAKWGWEGKHGQLEMVIKLARAHR